MNSMKTANLIIAIIYSLVFVALFILGLMEADTTLVIGIIFYIPLVAISWINWNEFKKIDKKQ